MCFMCVFILSSHLLCIDENVCDGKHKASSEGDQSEGVDPGQEKLAQARDHMAQAATRIVVQY